MCKVTEELPPCAAVSAPETVPDARKMVSPSTNRVTSRKRAQRQKQQPSVVANNDFRRYLKQRSLFQVNRIIAKSVTGGRICQYLVTWAGYPDSDATWETDYCYNGFAEALNRFEGKTYKLILQNTAPRLTQESTKTKDVKGNESKNAPNTTDQTKDKAQVLIPSVRVREMYEKEEDEIIARGRGRRFLSTAGVDESDSDGEDTSDEFYEALHRREEIALMLDSGKWVPKEHKKRTSVYRGGRRKRRKKAR